jgi:hypothetical protein
MCSRFYKLSVKPKFSLSVREMISIIISEHISIHICTMKKYILADEEEVKQHGQPLWIGWMFSRTW